MLGGAMTGPVGAVTPCAPPAPGGPSSLPPSSSDSSLSGWVRGAMGQRPTFACGGPVTYRLRCARKPATQFVPYSQAMWDCQAPRSSFLVSPPVPGALTSISGSG
jgi:hypothetical protein